MKKLLLPLFFLFVSELSAQKIIKTEKITEHSTHIIGDSFEGVIFSKDYKMDSPKRFTPTIKEIKLTEKALNDNIDTLGSGWFQIKFIRKHLKSYARQYFGYFNDKGERVIYINLLAKSQLFIEGDNDWMREKLTFLDGGPAFWQIKINLDKLYLFDFMVNGLG